MAFRKPSLLSGITLLLFLSFTTLIYGAPFGAPDARSAAMGKTGVASVGSTNAGYFNPALLASFSQRKHLGENQRLAVPSISAYVSESALELEVIDDAGYETRLNNAIADFNNNANVDDILNTLRSLNDDLNVASSVPLFADVHASMNVRVPDRQEGGAFYYGMRALLDGNLFYSPEDAALVADYLEELEFVNNGGTPGTLHPELYFNGDLINPNDNLNSSVAAAALVIEELGFSMGWAVTWWDMDMMVGFTPKIVQVTTYEYTATATSGDLTQKGEDENDVNLNMDLGWAKQLNDRLTVGVTLKNLFPQDYRTESNSYIKLRPQLRIGGAYLTKWGNYAVDLDLTENDPLSNADPYRELGLGGEWGIWGQKIRAGVVSNIGATGSNKSPLYTFGFRIQYGLFHSDFNYGHGKNQKSAALQIGLLF